MLLRSVARGRRGRGCSRAGAGRGRRPARLRPSLKPCYVSRRRRPARAGRRSTATDFTPFATVDIFVDDALHAADRHTAPTADANGDAQRLGHARRSSRAGQRFFTLRLTEREQPGEHGPRRRVEGDRALGRRSSPIRPRTHEPPRALPRAAGSPIRLTPVYAHYVFDGQVAQDGADRQADRRLRAVLRATGGSSRSRSARRSAPGRSSSTRSRPTTRRRSTHAAADRRDPEVQARDQAGAGSGSLTRVRSKRRSPSSASTVDRGRRRRTRP